jgi:DNA topoisomerase-3
MTSVAGHIVSHDFEQRYKKWSSCDPSALFEARIESYIEDGKKGIAKNIEVKARWCQYLYIWTAIVKARTSVLRSAILLAKPILA